MSRGRTRAGYLLLAAVPVVVLGLFFLYPVGGMVARGFWPGGVFSPGQVAQVFDRSIVRQALWFTLWSAAAGTAGSLLLGIPVAWVLHRLRFPGRDLVRALVMVPFVLPTVVVGVAFRQLLTRLPDIELAGPPVPLEALGIPLVGGIKHLPVKFTPTPRVG